MTNDFIEYYEMMIYARELERKELEIERVELKEMARNEDKEMTAAKLAWAAAKTKAATQRNGGK